MVESDVIYLDSFGGEFLLRQLTAAVMCQTRRLGI